MRMVSVVSVGLLICMVFSLGLTTRADAPSGHSEELAKPEADLLRLRRLIEEENSREVTERWQHQKRLLEPKEKPEELSKLLVNGIDDITDAQLREIVQVLLKETVQLRDRITELERRMSPQIRLVN